MAVLEDLWTVNKTGILKKQFIAFLGAQWIEICLPVQGTLLWPWSRKIPCALQQLNPRATNYWACALEPTSCNCWTQVLQPLKPTHHREEWLLPATARESPHKPTKYSTVKNPNQETNQRNPSKLLTRSSLNTSDFDAKLDKRLSSACIYRL